MKVDHLLNTSSAIVSYAIRVVEDRKIWNSTSFETPLLFQYKYRGNTSSLHDKKLLTLLIQNRPSVELLSYSNSFWTDFKQFYSFSCRGLNSRLWLFIDHQPTQFLMLTSRKIHFYYESMQIMALFKGG